MYVKNPVKKKRGDPKQRKMTIFPLLQEDFGEGEEGCHSPDLQKDETFLVRPEEGAHFL